MSCRRKRPIPPAPAIAASAIARPIAQRLCSRTLRHRFLLAAFPIEDRGAGISPRISGQDLGPGSRARISGQGLECFSGGNTRQRGARHRALSTKRCHLGTRRELRATAAAEGIAATRVLRQHLPRSHDTTGAVTWGTRALSYCCSRWSARRAAAMRWPSRQGSMSGAIAKRFAPATMRATAATAAACRAIAAGSAASFRPPAMSMAADASAGRCAAAGAEPRDLCAHS
jgi:hypothetical protein